MRAMLAKLGWRLVANPNVLCAWWWEDYITQMGHFCQQKMDHEHHGSGVVVLTCCDILGKGMRKQVGDNRTTKKLEGPMGSYYAEI